MDALFAFVAPIEAYKISVIVDWLSRHFSKKFNIRIKHHGFSCTNVPHVPRGNVKNRRATNMVVIDGS